MTTASSSDPRFDPAQLPLSPPVAPASTPPGFDAGPAAEATRADESSRPMPLASIVAVSALAGAAVAGAAITAVSLNRSAPTPASASSATGATPRTDDAVGGLTGNPSAGNATAGNATVTGPGRSRGQIGGGSRSIPGSGLESGSGTPAAPSNPSGQPSTRSGGS